MTEYEIETKKEVKNEQPIKDNKLSWADAAIYLEVSRNLYETVEEIIEEKNSIDRRITFFYSLIFFPMLLLILFSPGSMMAALTIVSSTLSFVLYSIFKEKFYKKVIPILKSFKTFQYELHHLFREPILLSMFSKLANQYDNQEKADKFCIELYDFFQNIKSQNITVDDLDFFINQQSYIKSIKQEREVNDKIEFIKKLQTQPEYFSLY